MSKNVKHCLERHDLLSPDSHPLIDHQMDEKKDLTETDVIKIEPHDRPAAEDFFDGKGSHEGSESQRGSSEHVIVEKRI